MRFAGLTALVTGSSRGIGHAIALRLAEEGADVVVHFRRNTDAAKDAAAAVVPLGRGALAVQADLGEPRAVDALFDKVRVSFDNLDILVANAFIAVFVRVSGLLRHRIIRADLPISGIPYAHAKTAISC